ncbi:MAG: hypothetical protein N3B01_09440 [Verrucomicrobiae bacterium]|nr:hypothetical protein [Verrucomicrobiae bacterium]
MQAVKVILVVGALLGGLPVYVFGQARPYIGFVYPAGGQQGTTFQVRLGGQGLGDVYAVTVSGTGVSARLVEYWRPLGPIDVGLLGQQLRELRRPRTNLVASAAMSAVPMTAAAMTTSAMAPMTSGMIGVAGAAEEVLGLDETTRRLATRLERRIAGYCNLPACASLAGLVFVEVTIAPDAPPGEREIRVVTRRGGPSNPLPFHVGQLPEYCRKPMKTSDKQILGKEHLAKRTRPEEEVENQVVIPCTVNGQVASGEVNRYRFHARKGQRLVITTLARQLIPYIADAVPGWFQPVVTLLDADGREVAYNDDYRFKPDPVMVVEIPRDGEYVLQVTDALYRGREDFVYRITIGEVPFLSSIFPLGGRAGEPHSVRMNGYHLEGATLHVPPTEAPPGIHWVFADRRGFVSNRLPFAIDTLPEVFEKEPNNGGNGARAAQRVVLPVIVNGRIDGDDDWDVFEFEGRAGETVVAEVLARRLESPMDSVIKLTDARGQVIAFNDDSEDLGSGHNTHHADSYFMVRLPADGIYRLHIGDTSGRGGPEYGYRVRISPPRPDFELRVMTSSLGVRQKSYGSFAVIALRKDGFNGPIRLTLKNPPPGFVPSPVTMAATQNVARVGFTANVATTNGPVNLTIIGTAKIGDQEVVREAVPAEDRMQAFLWRHLLPAQELKVLVYDPNEPIPQGREPPPLPPVLVARAKAVTGEAIAAGRTITKGQVAGRIAQLNALYKEGLFTDEFYWERVAECGDPP